MTEEFETKNLNIKERIGEIIKRKGPENLTPEDKELIIKWINFWLPKNGPKVIKIDKILPYSGKIMGSCYLDDGRFALFENEGIKAKVIDKIGDKNILAIFDIEKLADDLNIFVGFLMLQDLGFALLVGERIVEEVEGHKIGYFDSFCTLGRGSIGGRLFTLDGKTYAFHNFKLLKEIDGKRIINTIKVSLPQDQNLKNEGFLYVEVELIDGTTEKGYWNGSQFIRSSEE